MGEVVDLLVVGKKNYSGLGKANFFFFSQILLAVTAASRLCMAKLPLPPELSYEFSAQCF